MNSLGHDDSPLHILFEVVANLVVIDAPAKVPAAGT
jgi:hypothetical protein